MYRKSFCIAILTACIVGGILAKAHSALEKARADMIVAVDQANYYERLSGALTECYVKSIDARIEYRSDKRADSDFALSVIRGDCDADADGNGIVDGRDVAARTRAETTADLGPPGWPAYDIAALKSHPNYPDVLAALAAYLMRPATAYSASGEAKIGIVDVCAQWEAFTGEWPRRDDTIPILNSIARDWPLPLDNFNHQLTLWYVPKLVRAAMLSPTAAKALRIPLRWIEARMLEPQIPFKAPTAIYSTNVGAGLRDMVLIRGVLYGKGSADDVAARGFGSDPTQWGIPEVIDKVIDDYGVPIVNPAAPNHWAWTLRQTLVELIEQYGYRSLLNEQQLRKWHRFYDLPCTMLCAGGKSFTIPGVNDTYSMNPVLGPPHAWTRTNNAMDDYARFIARTQSPPTFDWLLVPGNPPGYVPPVRPEPCPCDVVGCSGFRDLGRIVLYEDVDGNGYARSTRVEYLRDSVVPWGGGGHYANGPRTVIVEADK